jgi:two-component system, cell cycle sensor histidine kinase and response regulator CckA
MKERSMSSDRPAMNLHLVESPRPGENELPSAGVMVFGDRHTPEWTAPVAHLAGQVAHHLNNILTVIDGNTLYVLERLDDERLRQDLLEVRNACSRAAGIGSQLLSISGRRWGHPLVVDLREVVQALDPGGFFGGDTIFCTDFTLAPCPVRVDPAHLQEVVIALVLNAREALNGGGTVRMSIDRVPSTDGPDEPGPGSIQLELFDSGSGMDQDTLEQALQPWFSTHVPSLDRGLGLAVAHGFVRQSGGELALESAPGQGTTVRIRLPSVH